jgi:DNA polymerase III subunit beta
MKISVSQPNLAQALSVVSHAVSSRSTLTILENILITTEQDRICLSGTNLELGLRYWIPAQIDEPGSITVPAKLFTDHVNTLPADTVSLTLNETNQTVTVRCQKVVTDIRGIEASEFPPMPEFDSSQAVSFEMPEIKKMIGQVAFAAAVDDNRPVLHGVKMSVNDNILSMAATDGYRIAIKKIVLSESLDAPLSAIIPATALRELARIAGSNTKTVSMAFCGDKSQVIFHLDNAELISSLIAGEFINYEAIVPTSFKTSIVVSTAALQSACSQAGVIARDNKNLIKLDIKTASESGTGSITIMTQAEQSGGSQQNVIEANVDGEDIQIAFNVRYLKDVLDVVESQNVYLRTNATMAPAMISPVDDQVDYKYVIMPMHFA